MAISANEGEAILDFDVDTMGMGDVVASEGADVMLIFWDRDLATDSILDSGTARIKAAKTKPGALGGFGNAEFFY